MATGMDGELVGLHYSDQGRSCNSHECCGKTLKAGELIRFKLCVVVRTDDEGDEVTEEAIKVARIMDGTETCVVGFLPKHCVVFSNRYDNVFAQVLELYEEHENSAKRRKGNLKGGMASYRLINDILTFEE
jgi:hypothetical protein